MLRGQLLGALACLATGCLQRFAFRSFEIPQRTLDLLARVQQIASRLLSRFALGTTLSLANVALPAGEVRHARPRILEHRRGFVLAGRERLGSLLELLDQRRDVAFLARQPFFSSRDDVFGQS